MISLSPEILRCVGCTLPQGLPQELEVMRYIAAAQRGNPEARDMSSPTA